MRILEDGAVLRFLVSAEAMTNRVAPRWRRARDYYENDQAPDAIPADKEYIQKNLITNLVNRLVAKLIGLSVNLKVLNTSPAFEAFNLLFKDILKESKFHSFLMEKAANFFFVEGLAGWKVSYNPMKIGRYGIGNPDLKVFASEDILLDPDSDCPMHSDDNFRAIKTRMMVSEANARWPDTLDGKKIVSGNAGSLIHKSENDETEEQYATIYEVEAKVSKIVDVASLSREEIFALLQMLPVNVRDVVLVAATQKTNSFSVEYDEFVSCYVANGTQQITAWKPTGFRGYTIIPMINFPRRQKSKLPFGICELLIDTQDRYNIGSSVVLEMVKNSVKNTVIASGPGATEDFEVHLREEIAQTDGVVTTPADVVVKQLQQTPVSPALLQQMQLDRDAIDELSGEYAPERGAVSGDMSGRAVALLQQRGSLGSIIQEIHIRKALGDVADRLLEIAQKKMVNPFSISAETADGAKEVFFNFPSEAAGDVYEKVHMKSDGGILNMLEMMSMPYVEVDIEIDAAEAQQIKANTAMVANQSGLLSMKDTISQLYPKQWEAFYANKVAEDGAMQMVQMLMEIQQSSPELFQQIQARIAGAIDATAQAQAKQQESTTES